MDDFPGDRRGGADRGADRLIDRAARPQTEPGAAVAVEEGDLDLRGLVSTLWRRKFFVMGAALAFAVAAMTAVYAVTPLYTASSVVMLDREEDQVIDLASVVSGVPTDFFAILAEVEVLKSRNLAGRVIEALRLETLPEFNPLLIEDSEPPLPIAVLAGAVDLLKSVIRGAVQETEAPGRELMDEAIWIRQTAIDLYLANLGVASIDNTYVYRITVRSTDPILSARIADKHADLYILEQLEGKFEATQAATEWLTNRVAELGADLEAAEARVEAHVSATSLTSEVALGAANTQLKDLRERQTDLMAQAEEGRAAEAALRAALEVDDYAAAAASTGQTRLLALARELTALRAAAGATEARAVLETQFDRGVEDVIARRVVERERVTRQLDGISVSIVALETQLGEQTAELVALRQYQREAEASGRIYEQFLRRLNETSVQVGVQQADARVLSAAAVNFHPTFPKKTLSVLVAGVLGAVFAMMMVIVLEKMNRSFRSSDDLEKTTGLGVLGQIPAAPVRARRSLMSYAQTRASSSLVEAIRNMRTGILLANMDRPPKAIMVTSSLPKEGKTTCSLLLAQNAAGLGKKVLLVECDLRRRTFRSYFDIKGDDGLMSILTGEKTFDEVVHRDEASGVDVVPGQETKANAADIFASRRFAEFIEMARARYDFVVVDTPPVLAVPDARVIAPLMDAVIYCVRWNATHRDLVRAGIAAFAQIQVRVTGLALTQINLRQMANYSYGGYGYYYYKSANTYYTN